MTHPLPRVVLTFSRSHIYAGPSRRKPHAVRKIFLAPKRQVIQSVRFFRPGSSARPARVGSPPMTSSTPSPQEMTELLAAWSDGDREALDRLLPLVERELHRLAHHYMSREREGHTLQTSALVNEAYLKLCDQTRVRWQNRAHFFAIAARVMRRFLTNYARDRHREKR